MWHFILSLINPRLFIYLGIVGLVYFYAYNSGVNSCRSELIKARIAEQKKIEAIDAEYQAQIAKIKKQNHATYKEVTKYVKESPDNPECIDARGLSILQRARIYPGGTKD